MFLLFSHSFWLRDHCHCPECYHSITKQRLVNTFKIPRDVTPKSVTPTATGIEVIWSNDDHKSHYTYSWLNKHSYDPKIHDPFRPEGEAKITWDNSIASHLPEVAFKDVMNSEQGLAEWLNNIHIYGFSYVSGVPVSTEATEELARRIAFIRESHYGGFWDFTSDLGHGDTAYTDIALGVHTDTTYFTDPVGLQCSTFCIMTARVDIIYSWMDSTVPKSSRRSTPSRTGPSQSSGSQPIAPAMQRRTLCRRLDATLF
ncbi:unnamed protein product [Mortierella alpina]